MRAVLSWQNPREITWATPLARVLGQVEAFLSIDWTARMRKLGAGPLCPGT